MKKLFTFIAVICLALNASAQSPYQVVNYDFEGAWVACTPWEKGDYLSEEVGTEPNGWCVSNVFNDIYSMPSAASSVSGENNGTTAIKLTNQSAAGQSIPAYLTLGTTWATAETKLTTTRNEDGGSFGGYSFKMHPDAIEMRYQRDNSKGTERASLVAYLWKGYWEQANVPSNTAVGIFSWGTATKVTMTDRDRNILGMDTPQGGAVTAHNGATLIASLESYITEGTSNKWKTWMAEFDYKTNDTPEKINIVVSATDYFAGKSAVVEGNSLTVDYVKLLYYSELASATYNGNAISFNGTSATVNEYYDASKLSITSNGHGAKVETSMDESKQLLTVTIKGENISEDASNFHTYTIQFKQYGYDLLSLAYNGVAITGYEQDGDALDVVLDEEFDINKLSYTLSEYAESTFDYDEETGFLAITVTSKNGNSAEYDFNIYRRGDINNDSQVSIADVTSLVNIILGKQPDYKRPVADVNDDGGVTIADVTALVNIILGKN